VCLCEIKKLANKARNERRKVREREKAKRKREEAREPEWFLTSPADDARGAEAVLARERVGERQRDRAGGENGVIGGHLQVVQGVHRAEGPGLFARYLGYSLHASLFCLKSIYHQKNVTHPHLFNMFGVDLYHQRNVTHPHLFNILAG
jgi:hypothetical protein